MTDSAQIKKDAAVQGARHEKKLPPLKRKDAVRQIQDLFCQSSSSCVFGELEAELVRDFTGQILGPLNEEWLLENSGVINAAQERAEEMARKFVKDKRRHEVFLAEREVDGISIIFNDKRDILAIEDNICTFFGTRTHRATFFKLVREWASDDLTFELTMLRDNIKMNTTTI